jgi:O-antigen/teichoic acid export membrane protein
VSRSATAIAVGFVFGAAAQIALNLYGLRGKLHFYRLRLGGVGLQRLVREALILFAFALVTGIAWWRLGLEEGKEGWQLGVLMGAIVIYLLLLWWRARGSKQLMGRFVALMVPLLLGIIIAKYRDLATNYFTSFTQSGIFSDKQFAESVGNLPTVLWAYALAIAMFPYLCEMASRKDLASFGSLITRALRMIALFFVPLSLVMVILARPIVQVVYDNGSWPARHVGYCGLALAAYSAAMFFYAIENVLMQSFFSIQRMWAPTVVGMISSIGQFLFLYVGIVALGHNQPVEIFWFVIVAFPISRTLKNLILIFILRYHVPILPAKETVAFGLRLAAVAAVVAGVTYASYLPISKALKVSSLKAEDIVVDTFNPGEENALGEEPEAGATVPHGWRKVRPAGMRVENVAQGDEPAEFALRADIPGFSIERDLSKFDLSRASTLSFKVKSDREAVLRVTLTGPEAQRDYKVTIKKSEKREKYEVALGNPLEAKKPQAILFEDATPSGPSGALWLDTIVFKGSFTTGQRVKFEIFKLIQALVPMGLGILALVGAAVAFRVEEMRIIYVWLKEEGLARIKDKIKGGKGRREGQGAATGPKAAPMPDVE